MWCVVISYDGVLSVRKENVQSRREMEVEWHLSDCSFWKRICFTRSKTAHFYTSSPILREPFQIFWLDVLRLDGWFSCWVFLPRVITDFHTLLIVSIHQDKRTKRCTESSTGKRDEDFRQHAMYSWLGCTLHKTVQSVHYLPTYVLGTGLQKGHFFLVQIKYPKEKFRIHVY